MKDRNGLQAWLQLYEKKKKIHNSLRLYEDWRMCCQTTKYRLTVWQSTIGVSTEFQFWFDLSYMNVQPGFTLKLSNTSAWSVPSGVRRKHYLRHYSTSWERDPSSIAFPEVSTFFLFVGFCVREFLGTAFFPCPRDCPRIERCCLWLCPLRQIMIYDIGLYTLDWIYRHYIDTLLDRGKSMSHTTML